MIMKRNVKRTNYYHTNSHFFKHLQKTKCNFHLRMDL